MVVAPGLAMGPLVVKSTWSLVRPDPTSWLMSAVWPEVGLAEESAPVYCMSTTQALVVAVVIDWLAVIPTVWV
jgi:hypothetical protein